MRKTGTREYLLGIVFLFGVLSMAGGATFASYKYGIPAVKKAYVKLTTKKDPPAAPYCLCQEKGVKGSHTNCIGRKNTDGSLVFEISSEQILTVETVYTPKFYDCFVK
jgi:hypothetical protein